MLWYISCKTVRYSILTEITHLKVLINMFIEFETCDPLLFSNICSKLGDKKMEEFAPLDYNMHPTRESRAFKTCCPIWWLCI